MSVVIVGAGMAALRTAEALRANRYTAAIDIYGSEPHLPYNRPPLSKEGLRTELAHEKVAFKLRASVEDVQWHLGTTVVASDLSAKTTTTATGETIHYDALIAATGVRARTLPIEGPTRGRFVVRSLDDAMALRPHLTPGARVIVLGAGFIGCEVAATATQLGAHVTNVAIDPLPMIRPLGELLAKALQQHHESQGVVFHLGVGVTRFLGDDHVTGVELTDGTTLDADLVVEALGSAPNVEWLSDNGLDLTDGVLTDNALRPLTSGDQPVDGIAVVGDLARFPNPRFDDRAFRIEHWNIPTETGRRAGAVIAAYLAGDGYSDITAPGWTTLPAFWSDQFDLRLQSYGMPGLGDEIRLLHGEIGSECVVGYYRDEVLEGVVAIGALKEVNSYRDRVGRVSEMGVG